MPTAFALSAARLKSLRTGRIVVPEPAALFRVEGQGALTCLQGLLTSDLASAGEGSFVYGALLTPKGMIVVDPWVVREGERFTLLIAPAGREAAAQLFNRVLPPRLAQVTDLTDQWKAAWVLGSCGLERVARASGVPLPGPGRVSASADRNVLLAGGSSTAPFSGVVLGPTAHVEELLARAGNERGDEADLAAARVLAGWPTLGREIDERTLPQEARFDELGAVSYVKGCYTGQETVARVHFRGHVNRTLRGIRLVGAKLLDDPALKLGDREVGTVRTLLLLEDHSLALAVVRREVEDGTALRADDRAATVVPLPFDSP